DPTYPCYSGVPTTPESASATSGKASRGGGLGPATASCHGLAGHLARAGVAQIGLLGTAARVREVNAHHGSFGLVDFLAAIVADQPRHACHGFSSSISRFSWMSLAQSLRNLG